MILAKKVRIKPTSDQEKQLWKSSGVSRWAYNWALNRQMEHYEDHRKQLCEQTLRKQFTQIKQTEKYAWLYDVSNNITKQAIKDLCKAYSRYINEQSK